MRRFITILLLLVTQNVNAAWYGMPLETNGVLTNAVLADWEYTRTNVAPHYQIWSGVLERAHYSYTNVEGFYVDVPSNTVVTNGGVVYTNQGFQRMNYYRTNILAESQYVIGSYTGTVVPSLYDDEGFEGTVPFLDAVDMFVRDWTTNFLNTNALESTYGTFNDWFVTNGGGANFPKWSIDGIWTMQELTSISNWHAWTGETSDGMWLYESHYTGAWSQLPHSSIYTPDSYLNRFNPGTNRPAIRCNSTSAVNVSVAITGTVDNLTKTWPWLTTNSETVALSDTNWTALTYPYQRIEIMVPSGAANTGDWILASWNVPVTTYAIADNISVAPQTWPYTLRGLAFDERWKAIDPLRFVVATNTRWGVGTQYVWSAFSSNSWAEALSILETNVTISIVTGVVPQCWMYGVFENHVFGGYPFNWNVTAKSVQSYALSAAMEHYTNTARNVQWYTKFAYINVLEDENPLGNTNSFGNTHNSTNEWDNNGTGFTTSAYYKAMLTLSVSNMIGLVVTSAIPIGNINYPAECIDPYLTSILLNEDAIRGYSGRGYINVGLTSFHDLTPGLVYK